MDRIVELTLLDVTFDRPADFDVQAYLATEPHTQPQARIKLRFEPDGALLALDDRAMWDTVKEQPDGSVVATMDVASLEWAAGMVLSYSPHVQVLEPEDLRRMVSERARAVAALYGSVV